MLNKYQGRSCWGAISQCLQCRAVKPNPGTWPPSSGVKDLLWVAMQGWKYWKNIEGLSHDGPAHLQVTDLPEIRVFFGNSCSLSFGEYYRLKSVKFDSSHPPWEAPAAGLSHSSQWLWSPRLQPRLSITQGMWGKDRTSSPHPQPQESLADWFITCQEHWKCSVFQGSPRDAAAENQDLRKDWMPPIFLTWHKNEIRCEGLN